MDETKSKSKSENYIYPRVPEIPYSNGTWVHLQAMKIQDIPTNIRYSKSILNLVPDGDSFKLLLPESFSVNVGHAWEEYESVTGKLIETLSRYYKASRQIQMGGAAVSNITEGLKSFFTGAKSYRDVISKMESGVVNAENVIWTRVDSPLVYKKSNPVEYNINFDFSTFWAGGGKKPTSDGKYLNQMIKSLMKLSSPEKKGVIEITPPHVFSIKTFHGNSQLIDGMLNLNAAALTVVQPEYKGPFIEGYPKSVSLQLSFVDITPLFSETFTDGSGVSVSPKATT